MALALGIGRLHAQDAPETSPSSQGEQPSDSPDDTPADDPAPVISPEALEKIRSAVQAEPSADLNLDLTFFLRVVESPPTFADYLAKAPEGWAEITPIVPPPAALGRGPSPASQAVGAGGINLLDIFRSIGRARQEREAQRIRRQIDRELAAFDRPRPSPPPDDTESDSDSDETAEDE